MRSPAADPHRPAALIVGGWAVTSRPGRVWLHRAWPAGDGDLTPKGAQALAVALWVAAAAAARHRAGGRSWTPDPARGGRP